MRPRECVRRPVGGLPWRVAGDLFTTGFAPPPIVAKKRY
jgi:hypothetical protein